MGTLGNQSLRNYFDISEVELITFVERIKALSLKCNVSVENILEATRILELRRQNNIRVEAGDYLDENLGGFGDILNNIDQAIQSIP